MTSRPSIGYKQNNPFDSLKNMYEVMPTKYSHNFNDGKLIKLCVFSIGYIKHLILFIQSIATTRTTLSLVSSTADVESILNIQSVSK